MASSRVNSHSKRKIAEHAAGDAIPPTTHERSSPWRRWWAWRPRWWRLWSRFRRLSFASYFVHLELQAQIEPTKRFSAGMVPNAPDNKRTISLSGNRFYPQLVGVIFAKPRPKGNFENRDKDFSWSLNQDDELTNLSLRTDDFRVRRYLLRR